MPFSWSELQVYWCYVVRSAQVQFSIFSVCVGVVGRDTPFVALLWTDHQLEWTNLGQTITVSVWRQLNVVFADLPFSPVLRCPFQTPYNSPDSKCLSCSQLPSSAIHIQYPTHLFKGVRSKSRRLYSGINANAPYIICAGFVYQ